ncbi:MAG: [Fe-S]-binding protein [Gammaproteobacteria bacterium]|nr:MAG: [Fe-S]-binding protein [Gammaproteobacteria bacterium]
MAANAKKRTVTIETINSSFELAVGDNLLDALHNSGHAVEYQCRSGYCGSCRMTVRRGQVSYDEYPLAHLGANEILPCCCRVEEPLSLVAQCLVEDDSQGDLF